MEEKKRSSGYISDYDVMYRITYVLNHPSFKGLDKVNNNNTNLANLKFVGDYLLIPNMQKNPDLPSLCRGRGLKLSTNKKNSRSYIKKDLIRGGGNRFTAAKLNPLRKIAYNFTGNPICSFPQSLNPFLGTL